MLTFNTFYTICDLLFLDSKPLKSLLNQESTFRAVCNRLNTKVPKLGDYKDVARYYGFDFYQIMAELDQAACQGEPTRTRALIMSLACSRPDETVEEFATVVEREAKRKDVSDLLRAYDMEEEAIEEL